MSEINELIESRRYTVGKRLELVHHVTGANEDGEPIEADEVGDLMEAYLDENMYGLTRTEIVVTPVFVDTNGENNIWRVDSTYLNPTTGAFRRLQEDQATPTTPATFYFDTTGGTEHILLSKETIASYLPAGADPGDSAPETNLTINMSTDGVGGTDITKPVYRWSETHYFDSDEITESYKGTIFALTGTVNNASFKGFAAGEVLFLGAQGSHEGYDGTREITYHFASSPNETDIAIGDITVSSKKGWEYLWVMYGDDVSEDMPVKLPIAAYVEKVYDEGDFSSLSIGT